MEDQFQNVKFRGGKISAIILAVSFASMLLVKFTPVFMPNYSNLLKPSSETAASLGCIDSELTSILFGVYSDAKSKAIFGKKAADEFYISQKRAETLANNYELLEACALELSVNSPSLHSKFRIGDRVDKIGTIFANLYQNRALMLVEAYDAKHEVDILSIEENKEYTTAENGVKLSWNEIEIAINSLLQDISKMTNQN